MAHGAGWGWTAMMGGWPRHTGHDGRFRLSPPFTSDGGYSWKARVPRRLEADSDEVKFRSRLCLYEDGKRLPLAHVSHQSVRRLGQGSYSHYPGSIRFSASDNSDPNRNGRTYEVDLSLTLQDWRNALLQALCGLWDFHPASAYLREQGGDRVPPPLFCNIGLTNKCNLRCEICGSQKFLDETGARRRHMSRDSFHAVAKVLFPFLAEVELNSQGDPLLHPDILQVIETINDYQCDIKVQTNGTLFTPGVTDALQQCSGTVMLSLDAVGPAFDEVRRGGVWAKAEPGLRRFLRGRDPSRLSVGIYPTLTRRTLPHALDVISWAVDHDLDEVSFHRYVPIQNSFEEAPSAADLAALEQQILNHVARKRASMQVKMDGRVLYGRAPHIRRRIFAHEKKQVIAHLVEAMMFPMDPSPGADPLKLCVAPDHYVEIGLDGQISACCRAQDVVLGYATSLESFAQTWFGQNYQAIRNSLDRDSEVRLPLPNCSGCLEVHAPMTGKGRRAANYQAGEGGLNFSDWSAISFDAVRKERGHCFLARVPPGIAPADYELVEDDRQIGPADMMHDDIRQVGQGRYSIWGRDVYFSASDNSDPRYNERRYALRRKSC